MMTEAYQDTNSKQQIQQIQQKDKNVDTKTDRARRARNIKYISKQFPNQENYEMQNNPVSRWSMHR